MPFLSRRRLTVALAIAVASLAVIAAGGGDDDDESHGGAEATADQVETMGAPTPGEVIEAAPAEAPELVVPVAATGLAYAVTEVTAPAGEITLRSVNDQSTPHNIAIDEPETTLGEIVSDGGTSEITVTLEPGTYEYYCSVPGHREAGMVGTLTVE